MISTNAKELARLSVLGQISQPRMAGYRHGQDGVMRMLPGTGGITWNVKVGDPVDAMVGDHLEPGVSLYALLPQNVQPLNLLACLGNKAIVVSSARGIVGAEGVVVGKHGGVDHVMVDFPDAVLKKLVVDDRIQIESEGLGLQLTDFPEIAIMNVSPDALNAIPLTASKDQVKFPVTKVVPAHVMGSGLGKDSCYYGDYDIQLYDKKTVEQFGLTNIRLGDFVAIENADNTFGRSYKSGFNSIGVVVHAASTVAGHGPGVMTIASGRQEVLSFYPGKNANIAFYLKIGRFRKTKKK
jgi:hypothetical protein